MSPAFTRIRLILALTLVGQSVRGDEGETRLEATGLPDGMITRVGHRPFLHAGTVTQLCFSPDGKLLVTGGRENIVRILSVPDGKMHAAVSVGPPSVNYILSLSVDAAGKFAVVGNGTEQGHLRLHVLELPGGKILHKLVRPEKYALAANFSSDGKRVFYVTRDGDMRSWNLATGAVELVKVHGFKAMHGILSPDRKRILNVASSARQVQIFDLETQQTLGSAECLQQFWTLARPASLSLDGTTSAVVQADDTVAVFDMASGKKLASFALPAGGPRDLYYRTVALAPNGKTLAVGRTNRLTLCNWAGEVLRDFPLRENGINAVDFSPDGKSLAVVARDNIVSLWSVASGQRIDSGSPGFVHAAVPSADGKTIFAQHQDLSIRAWDVSTGKLQRHFGGDHKPEEDVQKPGQGGRVAVSRDGQTLASVEPGESLQRSVEFWNPATGKKLTTLATKSHSGPPAPFAFGPEHDLAIVFQEPEMQVWQVRSAKLKHTFTPVPAVNGRVSESWLSATLSPDARLCALANFKRVMVWDLDGEKKLHDWPMQPVFRRGVAFSLNGQVLAAADSTHVFVWEVRTGKDRLRIPIKSASQLAFTHDGLGLIIGTDTIGAAKGAVQIISLLSGNEVHSWRYHHPRVLSIELTDDGERLLTVGSEGVAALWRMPPVRDALRKGVQVLDLGPDELWRQLGDEDAAKSFAAWKTLLLHPAAAHKALSRLLPVKGNELAQVQQLIAQLDDKQFDKRERVARELDLFGERAIPALEEALRGEPALEIRRRIALLLDKAAGGIDLSLRTVRALELAEALNTKDARAFLKEFAGGDPQAEPTRYAIEALKRLAPS